MSTATFTQQDIINAQTNAKIDILAQEMKDFKDEMRDFKNEMRDRDNRRAEEIAEIRTSVDGIAKHVQNFSIAAFAGIGAMVVTSVIGIAAMVWAVIPKG